MLFYILLAIAAIAAWAALGPGAPDRLESVFPVPDLKPVDFSTMRKSPKPNQYLVLPVSVGTEVPDIASPIYGVPATELKASWQRMIANQTDITARTSRDGDQLDFVQRTPRMRYPDLITVRFFDLGPQKSTLAIYSRSVYGHSDLGTNAKRIIAWLAALDVK
jgi:Protein of unknown function (DUF1499)